MKLWLISQDENNDYDTFDSVVVAAETEEQAKSIHPYSRIDAWASSVWASSPNKVKVKYLGEACEDIREPGIILASFNAG
jgi:hypothetical protein